MPSIYAQQEENLKLPKEVKDVSKQWFRKFAKSYPAYHFVVTYAKSMAKMRGYDEKTPEGIFGKVFGTILSMESNKDVNNDLRLVEIEKDLISLIEQTNNEIFYRPLFFPSIFINNDFNFEGLIIKGIYITECYTEPGSISYAIHHPKPNDYAVLVVSADVDVGCEFYLAFALVNKVIGDNFTDSKEETVKLKRLAEHVRIMICNVIDMVEGNKEDLEVVKIETTKEQNLKRSKKGQIAFPTKIFIKAKGEFKRYVGEYNKGLRSKISHSFQVRGHWRHFFSEKFVNVRGEKIWVLPYLKGKGILIRKDIKIIKQ